VRKRLKRKHLFVPVPKLLSRRLSASAADTPEDCVVAGFLEAAPDGGELDMSGMEMRHLGERWKLPTVTWASPASFATLTASWSLVGKSLSGRLPQRTA
jgi:hypothetical protein